MEAGARRPAFLRARSLLTLSAAVPVSGAVMQREQYRLCLYCSQHVTKEPEITFQLVARLHQSLCRVLEATRRRFGSMRTAMHQ